LGEECVQIVTVILEPMAADAEAHLGCCRRNAKLFQEFDEIRVSSIIENNESGIDIDLLVVELDGMGMRMSAGARVCFQDRDIVFLLQVVGGRQTRDSAADDSDPGHDYSACDDNEYCRPGVIARP